MKHTLVHKMHFVQRSYG